MKRNCARCAERICLNVPSASRHGHDNTSLRLCAGRCKCENKMSLDGCCDLVYIDENAQVIYSSLPKTGKQTAGEGGRRAAAPEDGAINNLFYTLYKNHQSIPSPAPSTPVQMPAVSRQTLHTLLTAGLHVPPHHH